MKLPQYLILGAQGAYTETFVYKWDGTFIWILGKDPNRWEEPMTYDYKSWVRLGKYKGYKCITQQCQAKRYIRNISPYLLKV